MLARQVERIRRSKRLDGLVIATSNESSDDPIEKLAKEIQVDCFRGSLNDVLDRFYKAAKEFPAPHYVRLTGDCPLSDPQVIDNVIELHFKGQYDYTSSSIELTFPDGLDVEAFRNECLNQAWKEAKSSIDRQHVTYYIYSHPEKFKIGSYKGKPDLSHYRWTVDEAADFDLITRIYESLYPQNPEFLMADILDLVKKNPELNKINSHIPRNEGFFLDQSVSSRTKERTQP